MSHVLQPIAAILLALPFVPVASVGPEQQRHVLHREWQVSLGPATQQGLYRATACADGSVFFSDGLGRVVFIRPDGAISVDAYRNEFARANALACGPDRDLYVTRVAYSEAGEPEFQMVIARPTDNNTFSLKTFPGTVGATAMTFAERDLFTVNSRESADGTVAFLHKLAPDRSPTLSFGLTPENLSAEDALSFSRGSVTWSPSTRRLVFVSHNPYVLQAYTKDGQLVRTLERNDPDFKTKPHELPSTGNIGADVVETVAALPSGELVTQVVKFRERESSRGYLEIFDRDLTGVLDTQIRLIDAEGAYGHLNGADEAGKLLFVVANPRGVKVIKASLARP